jgi:septum formation protein
VALVTEVLESRPLVLGSASPRRREILERMRLPHVVVVGDADEDVLPGEAPLAYVERVVKAKLDAVIAALPPDLRAKHPAILVADTTVLLGNDILGKPADDADAARMLDRLSGKTHEVATGFAIACFEGSAYRVAHAETVVTRVTFRELLEEEKRSYVAEREGRDKAGAYAVQGIASGFVTRIEGSYTNVVGLPAAEVMVALRGSGVLR